METDRGHSELVRELEAFLAEAKSHLYHDFHAQGATFPKVELYQRLARLIQRCRDGEFDNK